MPAMEAETLGRVYQPGIGSVGLVWEPTLAVTPGRRRRPVRVRAKRPPTPTERNEEAPGPSRLTGTPPAPVAAVSCVTARP